MKYLVTGGSGFLGEKLIERLVNDGNEVVTIARNEGKLIELQQKFPVQLITGSIEDPFIYRKAIREGIDGIFHLAAFKHVGLSEVQPMGCVKSNIIGTMRLLEAACCKPSIRFIIGISTDKAAKVSGVYGASKLIMEAMFREAEAIDPDTAYRIVRYGNVLYSTGSVLCKWRDALLKGNGIVVTERSATRFFWTIDQAVDLIFECLEKADSCVPYVPAMKAMKIGNLLIAMMEKYGGHGSVIKDIGLQPGENMHETMDGKIFSNEVPQYSIDEIMELI